MLHYHADTRFLFQSTPSQRGRPSPKAKKIRFLLFQSTPSQRGRLSNILSFLVGYNFNPRPRKEGDAANTAIIKVDCHFNPRPRKEGDSHMVVLIWTNIYFNPRPRKEGDVSETHSAQSRRKFQSTPSQRGRRSFKDRQTGKEIISIHALAKRATTFLLLSV